MSIAEDTISEGEETGLLPDGSSVSSNDDQGYDPDDSSSLFTDEAEVSAEVSVEAETPFAQDVNENSPLEELEVLYDASSEMTTDDSESAVDDVPVLQELEIMSDSSNESISENSETVPNIEELINENESTGDSVLEELEAMYGSSDESAGENSETVSNIEKIINENESTGDSVLQELDALLSGDSVESVVNSITDTDEVETSETAEYSSNESDNSGMSALDELKAFLGETASNEDGEPDETYVNNKEYSIANRRSILDELQNLLQSCIDELAAAAECNTGFSILSAEVEYPGRDELINLLETKLSQLMKISADSASTDYVAGGVSVLDELSDLLCETEINDSENVSDASVSLAEADEYVSSVESDDGASANDETVATDLILDELNELLGKSDDMDTETPASSSVSDYSLDDIPDEIPLLDPLEGLLSGSGEIENSEMLQDSSTASVADAEQEGNEKSVLEEFAAYMDGSSDLPGVGTEAMAEEVPVEETKAESVFGELETTSDTLEQLEAMLNESSTHIDEKSSETIQLNEDGSPIEYEAPQLSVNNEEEKQDDISTLKNSVQLDDVKTESQVLNSLQKAENNNRLPMLSMFLLAVVVIGVIVFWNLPGDQDSQANRLQQRQNRLLEEAAIVKAKPEFFAQEEVKSVAPVLPDYTDNVNGFSATIETAEFETEALYENEANDSYENEQYNLYEEPVQYDVDEALNNEVIDSGIEMGEVQTEQTGVAYVITENRIVELIVRQIQQVQDKTENNFVLLEESTGLLNERMVEAESSIAKLQFALEEHKHPEYVQPAYPETSTVNDNYQIKQAQYKNEEDIGLLTERLLEAELSISKLQSALEKAEQLKPVQPASPVISTMDIEHRIKQVQHQNEENIGLLNERVIEAELSISKLQSTVEKAEQLKPVQSAYPVTSTVNTEHQIKQVQDKNEKNFGLLNERFIEAESSISKLQLAVEKYGQLEPVQSVSSIASKMNAAHLSQQATGNLKDQTYTIWSVHLLSYYGKPPPAGELVFLDTAGVPYKIKRTIVKGGVWYRVLVNNSSEYSVAKEYAEMLKVRLGIKKIWLSKKQYTYD